MFLNRSASAIWPALSYLPAALALAGCSAVLEPEHKDLSRISQTREVATERAEIESAHKKFPRISQAREVGTACSHNDDASVKRAAYHPSFPTGGWNCLRLKSKRDPLSFVDYERTAKISKNELLMRDGVICGYVKFTERGYLQARSYDDFLGNVYCGWSPEKLEIKATEKPVFVSLGTCAVGDGGLDQIHEVCWFPKSGEKGFIVYSSAHKPPVSQLTAADLYSADKLGNDIYFNETLAEEAIIALAQKGELDAAQKVIEDSLLHLSKMRDAVEGSTGKSIPAAEMNRSILAELYAFKTGFCCGGSSFEPAYKNLVTTLGGVNRGSKYRCETIKKMLPVYAWLNDCLSKKQLLPITEIALSDGAVGNNPRAIAKYMNSEKTISKRETAPVGSFWKGIKKYLSGDLKTAAALLQEFLTARPSAAEGFEIAVAAKLAPKLSP